MPKRVCFWDASEVSKFSENFLGLFIPTALKYKMEEDFQKSQVLRLLFNPRCPNFLKEQEIMDLQQYVFEGGRLFIAAERGSADILNLLLKPFNVEFIPEELVQNEKQAPWILSGRVQAEASASHLPFKTLQLFSSGSFVSKGQHDVLCHYADHVIALKGSYGQGHFILLSDSYVLSPAFLGQKDNFKFWLYVLQDLLGGTEELDFTQETQGFLDSPLKLSMAYEKGNKSPFVDCRPFQKELEGLGQEIGANPYTQREKFIYQAAEFFEEFPKYIRDQVRLFKMYENEESFLVLKGLAPDPDLIQTPSTPEKVPHKATFYSEFYLSAVGCALGDVFTFIQEKGGNLFQNIFPTPHKTHLISSESSDILLDFHTEIAFHPVTTDYLMLYCLRSDHEKKAQTLVASINKILPHLPIKYYSILFEPVFQTGIDYSFGSPNGKKANGPVIPILSGDPLKPYFQCDFDLMVGLTPLAQEALECIKKIAFEICVGVSLEAGDLLIVDNNRALHGRTRFQARYDGYDRWLQRVLVSKSLIPSRKHFMVQNRTISVQFAA